MTTYDDIWKRFLTITKTESSNLPLPGEKTYDMIHSAIEHFNTQLDIVLEYDDTTETVNRDLISQELTLLAHDLRLSFYENQLTSYVTTWKPFQKEIGYQHYQTDIKALQDLIDRENDKIDKILLKNQSEYM